MKAKLSARYVRHLLAPALLRILCSKPQIEDSAANPPMQNRPRHNCPAGCCSDVTLKSRQKTRAQPPQTQNRAVVGRPNHASWAETKNAMLVSRAVGRGRGAAVTVLAGNERDSVSEGLSPNTFRYSTEKRPSSTKPKHVAISVTVMRLQSADKSARLARDNRSIRRCRQGGRP
jgi:hypothetical protein